MIVRIWTTAVVAGREADYRAFAMSRSRAMFLGQRGCIGVLFLRLGEGSHAACSFWRDLAAVDELRRSVSYQATAQALAETGVLEGDQSVVVYEVEGGALDVTALTAAIPGAGAGNLT